MILQVLAVVAFVLTLLCLSFAITHMIKTRHEALPAARAGWSETWTYLRPQVLWVALALFFFLAAKVLVTLAGAS